MVCWIERGWKVLDVGADARPPPAKRRQAAPDASVQASERLQEVKRRRQRPQAPPPAPGPDLRCTGRAEPPVVREWKIDDRLVVRMPLDANGPAFEIGKDVGKFPERGLD